MDYANKLSKISFFFLEIYLLTLVFFLERSLCCYERNSCWIKLLMLLLKYAPSNAKSATPSSKALRN